MSSSVSRRNFMIASAAAAGATWFDLPKLFADTRDASFKKYGGFPMGIQSYSLRGFGVDGALEKTHELELHHIEFFRAHFPPTLNADKLNEMKAKLKKLDISISAHGVQGFNKNHAANEQFFKFAKAAGIRNISANPTPDSFDSLDKLVKAYDIRIAIHNHGPGASYDKPADVLKAVKTRDKRIGFCADLGHYIRSGVDPVKVLHEAGDRLFGVHLKDFADQKKRTKGVILGKGHLDVKGVFKALKAVKFPADGALSLEYEENPKNPIEDIKQCLAIASEAAMAVAKG
jgi:inosose dehydratase